MKISRSIITAMVISCLILVSAGLSAAQPPVGIAGLTVTLDDGATIPAETTTDVSGTFRLSGVAVGAYSLSIDDIDPSTGNFTVNMKFQLDVPSEKAPADIIGMVVGWPDKDLGVQVVARVVAQAEADDLLLDRVVIIPKRWNLNFAHSNGKIKVKLHGAGLDAVTTVTLQTQDVNTGLISSIPSVDIKRDDYDQVAKARFTKSAVFDAIVPEGTRRGDLLQVNVIVDAAGVTEFYTDTKEVLIRGRKGR